MAIRRTPARAATADGILDEARNLVMANGWDRFSLRALARAVGLSPASLYEYFDNKEAILEGVAERARKRLIDRLRDVPPDASDRMVELAMAYVSFAREYREDFMLLFARAGEPGAPAKTSPYAVWLNQAARELHDKPHQVAYAVWACAHGLAMLQLTELNGVQADFVASDRAAIAGLVESFDALR